MAGLYVRNYSANLAGDLVIILLNLSTPIAFFKEWQAFLLYGSGGRLLAVFFPTIFALATLAQYFIQRPVWIFSRQVRSGRPLQPGLRRRAQRRLVNLPLILALFNLVLWTIVTLLFLLVLHLITSIGMITSLYIFFRGVIIGLLAAFLCFFLIDDYCRKELIPWLFPDGQLARLSGTVRISILRRIRVLYSAGTGAPMLILVGTLALIIWQMEDAIVSAVDFSQGIFIFILVLYAIFIVIGFGLNILVAMNEMTAGLMERERMRRSLNLAGEVQQALLPRRPPEVAGLDIACASVYCDETGGDYFDFLGGEAPPGGRISVVIGDVAGHGVSAALLMATARAFLRQRSVQPGTLSQVVSDVNRLLVPDVEESGAFMTLFYLTIDRRNRKLSWVRAGHDPAMVYDPASDAFASLGGAGMALGVDPRARFPDYQKEDLAEGQVILMATDGVWEVRNGSGEMYGREALCRMIRRHSSAGAEEILNAVLDDLKRFAGFLPPEDDLTMILVKVTDG